MGGRKFVTEALKYLPLHEEDWNTACLGNKGWGGGVYVSVSVYFPLLLLTMPSPINFEGVGKEELKAKRNKKVTLQDSKKWHLEEEIFEPTS